MKEISGKFVSVDEWDSLVESTYGKPYKLQQQDGCKDRGVDTVEVPCADPYDHEENEIPFTVNGPKMGVSFAAWIARDAAKIEPEWEYDFCRTLWFERNFYPSLQMVANDLHAKGLLAAGKYNIVIDW